MRRRTGDLCEQAGRYEFICYVDGDNQPLPGFEERMVLMRHGDRFPPVRSNGRDCWWRYVGP
ncbi:MAG TPA: YjzC family protein [bacterium]|nr:YjzC family protein [bacterium]